MGPKFRSRGEECAGTVQDLPGGGPFVFSAVFDPGHAEFLEGRELAIEEGNGLIDGSPDLLGAVLMVGLEGGYGGELRGAGGSVAARVVADGAAGAYGAWKAGIEQIAGTPEPVIRNPSPRRAAPPADAGGQSLVDSEDALSLVLQHLDLSQLMLIKSVCQSMARVVRRTVSSPSWLRATSGANLQAMRQAFASRSAIFQLPMRVCLERFDWASSRWHRSHGTLLELRAETAPQSIRQFDDDRDACCCRVHHVRFELDGEGAFEGTSRLFRGGSGLGETYDCSGWVPARSRAAGNELLDERHDMLEDADGLGLLRPVAMEAACRALGEIPLLGCRVSELVHSGGLFGDHGRPVAFCGRKRSRD